MGIYEKLMTIQQELNAPKGQYNSFGKYKYRSCEDILGAVKPLLLKTKTVLTLSDEIVDIGGRIYVAAEAKLTDTENSETIVVKGFAREEETKKGMDASQVTGASSSYARKYALNGLFSIDDNQDSDCTNNGNEKQEQKKEAVKADKRVEVKIPKADDKGNYFCERCGQLINGTVLSNGKSIDAKQVCERVLKKYGSQLCADCCNSIYSPKVVNLKDV